MTHHNKETNRWEDDDGGVYAYAVFNCDDWDPISSREPWIYAHSFDEALSSMKDMVMNHGITEVEIGLPNGNVIEIDARHTNAQTATDAENDSGQQGEGK